MIISRKIFLGICSAILENKIKFPENGIYFLEFLKFVVIKFLANSIDGTKFFPFF